MKVNLHPKLRVSPLKILNQHFLLVILTGFFSLFWLNPETLSGQTTCTWDGTAWDSVPPFNWNDTLILDISSGEATITGNYSGNMLVKTGDGILSLNGNITTTGHQHYHGITKLDGPTALYSLHNGTSSSGRIILEDTLFASGFNLTLSAEFTGGEISLKTITGADTVIINSYHKLFSSDILNANILNMKLSAIENASIGSVTSELNAGGDIETVIHPLKIAVDKLNVSTHSGKNSDGSATGNIVIENFRTGNLVLGSITTNGNRNDEDIANVIIITAGSMTGEGNSTHIDAWSADLKAENDISNLNSNLKYLSTSTEKNGNIIIRNISPALSLFNIIAREYGKVAGVTENNDVMVHDDNSYVPGTKNIQLTSTGNIVILGNISAPNEVTMHSIDSGIYTISGTGYTITSNYLTLSAGKGIGLDQGELSTITGNSINATALDGGVYIKENNRLTIGNITATGNENNIFLETRNGNAWFGQSNSRITAVGGKVSVSAYDGNISVSPDNFLEVIEADTAILVSKQDFGSSIKNFKIKVKVLSTSTSSVNANTYIENTDAITDLDVTTADGQVSIQSATTGLIFNKNTKKLTLTNGAGTSLSFSNDAGDIIIDGMNLGSNNLSLNTSGAIIHSSGQLIAGEATVTAGKNIGNPGNALETRVDSLHVTSGQDGIYINQSGALTLTANAQGHNSNLTINQTGTNNEHLTLKSLISSNGNITLTSSGNIIGSEGEYVIHLTGHKADLTAGGYIGNNTVPLNCRISNAGQSADLITNAHGMISVKNSGNLRLTANTNSNGDLALINNGDLTLQQVDVGSDNNISLDITGVLKDVNTIHGNLIADKLEIKAGAIGNASEIIKINAKELTVESTHGPIYLHQNGSGDVKIISIKSVGSVYFETSHGINLGTIEAPGQSVIIKALTGDILDTRDTGETRANIKSYSLDISAINLGTATKPLELDVSILSSSSTGDAHAENLRPLHVDASSLVGKGIGNTVSLKASGITVFDNNGGTTHLDTDGSLELIAKNGNIVFLNPLDKIQVSGRGFITMEALGNTLPADESGLVGNIIAGNLSTGGGNITLRAANHIGIHLMDAGTGNVTLQSNNGYIVDLNGPANNIIAGNITLSSKSITGEQAQSDLITIISDAGDRNNYANMINLLAGEQNSLVSTYQELVNNYQSKYNTSGSDVTSKQSAFNNASSEYDVAYYGLYAARRALNVAQIGFAIAEIPVGAAQAVPVTGDGGSHAGFAIAKLVLQVLITTVESCEVVQEVKSVNLADARQALSEARATHYTNEQLWKTNDKLLQTYKLLQNDYKDRSVNAKYAYNASQQLEILMREVVRNQNGMGSVNQPLGVNATGKIDATAFGESSIYLESASSLKLGHVDAQGTNSSVNIMLNNGNISILNQVTSIKAINLNISNGNIMTEQNGKLLSEDLAIVSSNGIGSIGNPIKTRISRIAAATATGPVQIANDGLTTLTVDEIGLTIGNNNNTISGISTTGSDISIETSKDLTLNKPVRDNAISEADRGTITLHANEGSIIGANIPEHIIGRELVAVAATGIGNNTIPLRTNINSLNADVRMSGMIVTDEISDIILSDINTYDGKIDINAGGNIEAVHIASATDAPENTITLSNTSGNITVHTITAGEDYGNIYLNSSGQVNNDSDTLTRITGNHLFINTDNGIGIEGSEPYRDLNTDIAILEAITNTGDINIRQIRDLIIDNVATGNGNISIMNDDGNLDLTRMIAAGRGNSIILSTPNGSIIPANNFKNLTVEKLALRAGFHIGSLQKPLKTTIDKLEAVSVDGDISISNQKSHLTIGQVFPIRSFPVLDGIEAVTGNIMLSTRDSMIINKKITALGTGSTITLKSISGIITGKSENPVSFHITGNTLDVTTALGIGSQSLPLRTDIDKLSANITGDGHVFINEYNHMELSSLNKMKGHITAGDNITVNTLLVLSDTTIFTSPEVHFEKEIVCSGNYLTINGEAIFNTEALWRSNATMFGQNDKMNSTGNISVNNLHIHAIQYAGKSYDIIMTDGNIAGIENVNCPGYSVSVVEIGNGKKVLRITSLHICDTAVDQNGNFYASVGIGSRCWMKSNLRATHYDDGRPIENRVYYADIYPNTAQNLHIFGRLYNWYAAMDTITTYSLNIEGLCPEGWEIPSKADFTELSAYDTEALKSNDLWLYSEGNNTTGFNALPAGYYDYKLNRYNQLRGDTYFWLSDPGDDTKGNVAHICYGCSRILFSDFPKNNAVSIRCVKK